MIPVKGLSITDASSARPGAASHERRQPKNRFGPWYDVQQPTRYSAVGRPCTLDALSCKNHQIDGIGHTLDLAPRAHLDGLCVGVALLKSEGVSATCRQ